MDGWLGEPVRGRDSPAVQDELAQRDFSAVAQGLPDDIVGLLRHLAVRNDVVAIQPSGQGLLLETLRAADEVKNASGYFSEIEAGEVDEDQLELARELIKRKTAPFDPTKFKDDYETALRELIEAKVKHREVREPDSAAPQAKVVDLMDALRRSLAVDKPPRGAPAEVRKLPARQKAKESAGGKPALRRSKSG